jgi:hypothetical protein
VVAGIGWPIAMIMWPKMVIDCLAVQVHGNLVLNRNKANQDEADGII